MNKYELAKSRLGITGSEIIEDIKDYGRGNHAYSIAYLKKANGKYQKIELLSNRGGYSVPWELRLIGKSLDEAVKMWGVFCPYPNSAQKGEVEYIPVKWDKGKIDYHVQAGMLSEKNGVDVIFDPKFVVEGPSGSRGKEETMNTEIDRIIKGFREIYENDKAPRFIQEIERQFDIEFNKRRISHGAKKTTGIWENKDYESLKKQFVDGIIKLYNPMIR